MLTENGQKIQIPQNCYGQKLDIFECILLYKKYQYFTLIKINKHQDLTNMKTEIVQDRYNPFLKRKELVIDIENPEEPTPSKAQLQHLLAKEVNKDVENIEILDIFSGHGIPRSKARVFVWDEKKVKDLAKKEEKPEGEAKTE